MSNDAFYETPPVKNWISSWSDGAFGQLNRPMIYPYPEDIVGHDQTRQDMRSQFNISTAAIYRLMCRFVRRPLLALSVACLPAAASAASYEFTWTGSNGYRVEGALAISDTLTRSDLITTHDVECFRITGYHNDRLLGHWNLGDLTPETSWNVNFKPKALRFPMGGSSLGREGQEWNMNGNGNSCGPDGFGFNSGTFAQDICVNGRIIVPSQVSRYKPLSATRNDDIEFKAHDCPSPNIS